MEHMLNLQLFLPQKGVDLQEYKTLPWSATEEGFFCCTWTTNVHIVFEWYFDILCLTANEFVLVFIAHWE